MKNNYCRPEDVVIILLLLLPLQGYCQIQTRFFNQPKPNSLAIKNLPIHKVLPNINWKKLLEEDSIESGMGKRPLRFGKGNRVNINLIEEGSQYVEGDSTHLIYQIYAKEAKCINLGLDKFELDDKTVLNIYDYPTTMLYGPITSKNNLPNGTFWTDLIKGERVILKVSTKGTFNKKNVLKISNIVYGYRGGEKSGIYGGGSSGLCERDTKCWEGFGWHDVDMSVGMLLIHDNNGDRRFGSGALINNAAQDFKPYFLTAFHNLDHDNNLALSAMETSEVSNWIFRFLYVAQSCGSLQESPNYITFNGSTLRAANSVSDFILLEMNNRPIGVNYGGWYRGSIVPSLGGVIHHPSGDVKKISLNSIVTNRNTPYTFVEKNVTIQTNTHWQSTWSVGVTEPASSGAPLFNADHRIVGQLHGGPSLCIGTSQNPEHWDLFGRFDVSWDGGGTTSTRLKDWLDPLNTGAMSTDSPCGSINGPALICDVGSFTSYPGVIWSTSNPAGLSISNGQAVRQGNFNGDVTITATVPEGCVVSKVVHVGNPSADNSTLIYPEGQRGVDPVILGEYATYQFRCDFIAGATSYSWLVPSGFALTGLKTSATPGIRTSATDGIYTLYCSAKNLCGTSYTHSLGIIISGEGGIQQKRIAVYPNPAQHTLTIEYIPTQANLGESSSLTVINSENVSQDTFSINLYNNLSREVKSGASSTGKLILEIQDLKDGLYYLHFQDKQGLITKQIQIKK